MSLVNDRTPLTMKLPGDITPTFPKECLNEHNCYESLLIKRILWANNIGKCYI